MHHRKRVKHYSQRGHAHFLTFSCFRRLPLLGKQRTCLWFLQALTQARARHQFDLWAWVIMPEHAHVLLHPQVWPYDIGTILNGIKKTVGQWAFDFLHKHNSPCLEKLTVRNKNRIYHRFWQPGSGWDENVTDAIRSLELIEYIHNNPVKRGLANKPEEYRWSSAAAWLCGVEEPIPIDRNVF